MSNLKEKFGKFELGKTQVKSVKGGVERIYTWTCTWVRARQIATETFHGNLQSASDFCVGKSNCTCTNTSGIAGRTDGN